MHSPNVDGERAVQTDPSPANRAEIERLTTQAVRLRAERQHAQAARVFGLVADALADQWLPQHNAGATALEAGDLAGARVYLERSLVLHRSAAGFSLYAHTLALAGDMPASRGAYENALALAPDDFAANWGLFEVNQLLDDNAAAVAHQRIALAQRSLISIEALRQPAALTLLELCIAGTFQANIPLDFILDPQRITVHKLYLGEHPIPPLPYYDLVFNTIAEAPDAGPALAAAARFIASQDRPLLNPPEFVGLTARESVAGLFARSRDVAVAPTCKVTRASALDADPGYPFLIRPVGSHAGNDLVKIDDPGALEAYFAATPHATDFYRCAFIDYRNADGYFRKYRIVFVAGTPYPVHMAISPRWMIHYYNAPMAEHAWMRDEEHAFMRDLDAVFGGARATGLREIAAAIPLDYFGIDCSIAADGRVLLFEASAAMIVHLRDSAEVYPYKRRYVPRIIDALERLMFERSGKSSAR